MKTVVVWGPSASGKTAWLAQISLRALAVDTPWKVFITDETHGVIQREEERIEKGNVFPHATQDVGGTLDTFSYKFKHRDTGAEFAVNAIDRPGIMYEQLPQEVRDKLCDADAMILMIDHGRNMYDSEVRKTLRQVHLDRKLGTNPDPRPVAVCLSKADELIGDGLDYQRAIETPEAFVRPRLDDELLAWIDQHYSCCTFLPISSVGLRLSYGRIKRSVFLDEHFNLRVSREGLPINLLAPFVWVFSQLERRE